MIMTVIVIAEGYYLLPRLPELLRRGHSHARVYALPPDRD